MIKQAKNGKKYKIYAFINGKKFTLESFDLDQKRLANAKTKKLEGYSEQQLLDEYKLDLKPIESDRVTYIITLRFISPYYRKYHVTLPRLETRLVVLM